MKRTVCITDDSVLENTRMKGTEKKEAEQAKKMRQVEIEQKRKEKEKQERKQAKAMERKRKKQGRATKDQTVKDLFGGMQISNEESGEDDAVCLKYRLMYSSDSGVWICVINVTIGMS